MEHESYRVLIVTPESASSDLSLQLMLVDSGLPGLSTYSSSSDPTTRTLLELDGLDAVVCRVRSRRGVETLRMIRETAPEVALVAVADSPDRSLETAAIEAGAEDCLFEDQLSSALLHRSVKLAVEHKRAEKTLERLSRYDPATGLLSQTGFLGLLERWLHRARGDGRPPFALLVFKVLEFNEVFYGFNGRFAEAAVRTAAERLCEGARPSDAMAILDGGQLVVLLPAVAGARQARLAASRITALLEQPLSVRQRRLELTVQSSVTLYDRSFEDARDMLETAVARLGPEVTRPMTVPDAALGDLLPR